MSTTSLKDQVVGFEEVFDWDNLPVLYVLREDKLEIAALGIPNACDHLHLLPFRDADSVVFIFEAYTYSQKVIDEIGNDIEKARELRKKQPPADHPDGIEIRLAVGVSQDEQIALRRERGKDPVIKEGDEVDDAHAGFVIEQLKSMIKT